MASGSLTSITYIDPWGISLPGTPETGVIVKTSGNPPSTVLAACLVQGTTQLSSGVGAGNNMVRIAPAAPLSPVLPYQVWLQWLPPAQTPVWPAPGMLTFSLVVSIPTLTSIAAGPTVAATWAFAAGASGNAGANVVFFDTVKNHSVGYIQAGGNSGSSSNIPLDPQGSYVAYIQAVQPASAQPVGGFTQPFAYGPWAAPIPVAAAAPQIATVSYDGTALTVMWKPVMPPSNPAAATVTSSLNLVDTSNNVLTSFPAGDFGASAVTNVPLVMPINIAGQVRFGPATGPLGTAIPVIGATPVIEQVSLTGSDKTITAAVTLAAMAPGLPAGTTIDVDVLQDGIVLAYGKTTTGAVKINFAPKPGSRFSLRASYQSPDKQFPSIIGPFTPPVGLVTAQLADLAASYDGNTLAITWSPLQDPMLTGYQVTLTPPNGPPVVCAVTDAQLVLPIALPPDSKTVISVRPLSALAAGLASAEFAYSLSPPTSPAVTACWFDGAAVTLAWAGATGIGIDGYVITLTGTPGQTGPSVVTASYRNGTDPAATLPVPLDDVPRTWTVTVAATVGSYTGSASSAVTIFTAVPVVIKLAMSGVAPKISAEVSWSLANLTPALLTALEQATLQFQVLDGSEIIFAQAAAIKGATGLTTVDLPDSIVSKQPTIAAQCVAAGAAGPRGGAVALLMVAPAMPSASYDGRSLTLDWSGGGGGITSYWVVLYPPSSSPVTFWTGAVNSFTTPIDLLPGQSCSATVQPLGTSTLGLISPSVSYTAPVPTTPLIAGCWCDGSAVALVWTPSTGLGLDGYVVVLTGTADAGGPPAITASYRVGSAPAAQFSLPLDDTPRLWTATVAPTVRSYTGPASAAATIITAVPVLSQVVVTGTPPALTAALAWELAGISAAQLAALHAAKLQLQVLDGDELVLGKSIDLGNGAGTASIALPQLPSTRLNVAAQLSATGAAGPRGGAAALLTVPPGTPVISYDATDLTLDWSGGGAGVTGYTVVLTPSVGHPVTLSSGTTSLRTPIALSPGGSCQATVQPFGANTQGLLSAAATYTMPLPTVPAPTSCSFDGDRATLAWTPSSGLGIDGYLISVTGTADDHNISSIVATFRAGLEPILSVALPLDDTPRSWAATVAATVGSYQGAASAPVTILTPVPVLSAVVVAGTPPNLTATANWSLAGATQGLLPALQAAKLQVQVLDGDDVILRQSIAIPAANGTLNLSLPASASTRLALAAQIVGSSAQGARGGAVALLTVQPGPPQASYDGTWLTLDWAGGGAGIAGHAVTLTPSTGHAVALSTGAESNLVTQLQLGLDLTWTVKVQPFGANTTGLASPAAGVTLPSVVAPVITSAGYQDGVVSVGWTASSATGVSYLLTLLANGSAIAWQNAGPALSASIVAELAAGTTYTVTVQVFVGRAPGAVSAPATLQLALPQFTKAVTDPVSDAVTLSWSNPVAGAATRLRLVAGGETSQQTVTGATLVVTPPPPGTPWSVSLAVQTTTGGVTTLGPFGPPVVLPTAQPELRAAGYDGTTLTVGWRPVSGASGYTVNVLQTGAGSPFAQAQAAASATEASFKPAIVDTDKLYSVVVQALFGDSSGPDSVALPILLAAPTLAGPSYDGQNLSVTVTPHVGHGGLTGYDQALLRNGETIQRASTPAPAPGQPLLLAIAEPPDPAASYALQVSARVGASVGPAASASILLAAPIVASISCDTQLTATVAAGPLPLAGLALQAVLYVDGAAGTPQSVGSDGKAVFAIPAGTRFAIGARGIAAGATGPWSAPVAALTVAPAITAATYTARQLAAAWTGTASGRAAVAISTAGAIVAQTVVDGGAALLGFAAAPGTAYNVQVNEIAGVASGPAATLALVTEGCSVSSASTDLDRKLTVNWTPPAAPHQLTAVQPILAWGGTETVLSAEPATTNPLLIALPASIPNGASVAVRAIAGNANGPPGSAAAVLTTAPTGLAVSYDGQTITASWDAAPDGIVSGYLASLMVAGQSPVSQPVGPPRAAFSYTVPAQDPPAVTVSVAAAAGVGTGAPCTAVPVIVTAPQIASAQFDGITLTLDWQTVSGAGVKGYLVSVLSGGTVTRQVKLGGSSGSFELAPGAYTVQIQAFGDQTVGPAGSAVTLIATAPAISSAAFDPVAGSCKVVWSSPAATEYRIMLFNGETVVADETVLAPVTDYSFAASTFQAQGAYTCTLTARTKSTGLTITGPTSTAFTLVATPPGAVSVAYNGATVAVEWDAVALPGVTGYRISALAGGAATTVGETSGSNGRFSLAADPTKSYNIVVQAISGPNLGAASAPVALTPQALFLSATSATAPYIAPALGYGSDKAIPATDIDIYLPNIFATVPLDSQLPSTAPFKMTAVSGQPPFAYKLSIEATSPAWSFTSDPLRSGLIDSYKAFLKKLQTAPLTATPIGIHLLRDAISRCMPQTFAELPYYAYGALFGGGYVDLRPGMVLRAEFESYQSFPPQTPSSQFLPGFVTTAVAEYEVASYLSQDTWLAGLDVFLANLTAAQGTIVHQGTPDPNGRRTGGGGLIDAFFTQFQQPFCRLVYPVEVLANDSIGSAYPYRNPVLIAATSLDNIETATQQLRNQQVPDGNSVAYFYLRGRTTFTALIRVTVNGAARLVPVGTTVGNLLAASGAAPPVAGLALDGLTMIRPRGSAILDPAVAQSGYPIGNAWTVRLNWSPGFAYNATTDWLALPLLHGDQIAWRGGGP